MSEWKNIQAIHIIRDTIKFLWVAWRRHSSTQYAVQGEVKNPKILHTYILTLIPYFYRTRYKTLNHSRTGFEADKSSQMFTIINSPWTVYSVEECRLRHGKNWTQLRSCIAPLSCAQHSLHLCNKSWCPIWLKALEPSHLIIQFSLAEPCNVCPGLIF